MIDLRCLSTIADAGLRPDPEQGREWLRQELSRGEYQQSPLARLRDWFFDQLDRILGQASGASALSTLAAVLILAVLLVVVVLVVRATRREGSGRAFGEQGSALVGSVLSAQEHRRRAEEALAGGRPEETVVEAVRAITRRLVDRVVLADGPGTTAHEMAGTAGAAFPEQAARLRDVADSFDRVHYGQRSATTEEARAALALDDELIGVRPVAAAAVVSAVPR